MFSIHHISLSVKNINDSVMFYEKLGFNEVLRWGAPDNSLKISHLKLQDTFLELFCFAQFKEAPDSAISLDTDLPRIGIKHFGIRVKSIKETKNALISKGLAEKIEIKRGKTDIDYFFIKDPNGIFLEFVQDDRGL